MEHRRKQVAASVGHRTVAALVAHLDRAVASVAHRRSLAGAVEEHLGRLDEGRLRSLVAFLK